MKIAFVCDWLTGMRGGERCLEAVCELYPSADIFALVHFAGTVSSTIESHRIRTSYIQRLPGDIHRFRRYVIFFPHAVRRFDLSGYDCVLSFSHCVAKGVKVAPDVPHICYCHSPMRYAWHMRRDYLRTLGPFSRPIANLAFEYLKHWDARSSGGVSRFIANSLHVQERIRIVYNRTSVVIYPPVDCSRFTVSGRDDGYYLIVSALVPYKRIDLAVEAFSGTSRRLLVVGKGPELGRLKRLASGAVTFVEDADDDQVAGYMQGCRALLFPGQEDFGIVPLEAQACGKPVIAFGKGGVLETVIGSANDGVPGGDVSANISEIAGHRGYGVTGLFFYDQTARALAAAVDSFERSREKFCPKACRENAERFDRPIYKRRMQTFIEQLRQ